MNDRTFTPSASRTRVLRTLACIAVVVLVLSPLLWPERTANSLLIASFFLLTVSLGSMLLIAFEYVTSASWSVAFRRVPEALAAVLWIFGLAMIGLVILRASDYAWRVDGDDPGTFWFKQAWLTPSFMVIRAVVYVIVWSTFACGLVLTSRRQDTNRGSALTARNRRISAFALLFFAPTFTLAAADWFMSLEPLWFSTVWGAYHFAGMVLSTLAVVTLLALCLRREGTLRGVFTDDHLHDLSKLMFGFSCFWMYLWFSQYMLIWYSNIPEETSYFVTRTQGVWAPLMFANLVVNWFLPFLVLLPRPNKRNEVVVTRVAVILLVGRFLDLYLMVYPSTTGQFQFGIPETAAIILIVSLLLLVFDRSFSRASALPVGDPHLEESVHGHHPMVESAPRELSADCQPERASVRALRAGAR